MPSLIGSYTMTVPTEYLDLAPGEEPTREARRWAREHPDFAGYLVVDRSRGRVRVHRRYLVAGGQVRPWRRRWPAIGECYGRTGARHLPILRFDADIPVDPWLWVCRWCGAEMERWPEVSS